MANKIKRTSAGLRDALFDAIEKLSSGDMDGEQAMAMAKVAAQICNSVKLEIEVAKLRTEYPADSPIVVPASLQLGERDEQEPQRLVCVRCKDRCDGSLMRHNRRYDRVHSIITADDIPRADDGRVQLCHVCQRAASWIGSFTLVMAVDLHRAAARLCFLRLPTKAHVLKLK